jgi:predicted transcriptional regulator
MSIHFNSDYNYTNNLDLDDELSAYFDPRNEDLAGYFDSTKLFDLSEKEVKNVTNLDSEKQNPTTVLFEGALHPLSAPEVFLAEESPQFEYLPGDPSDIFDQDDFINNSDNKRSPRSELLGSSLDIPAKPPISAQTNKKQKEHDPRPPLLKELHIQSGMSNRELCRRVNRRLQAIGSELTLAPSTLQLIEDDKTTKKTIDTYYDHINTILNGDPKALDPRSAHLNTLRTDTGLSTKELSKKLRAFSGIKLSGHYLGKIEKGDVDKDVIDNLYTDIKKFFDAYMSEENDKSVTNLFEETVHSKPQRRKRPAKPPVSAQTNKRQKVHDSRLPLLKERRIQSGISNRELCRRVNDHLKKTLGSQRPLNPNTLTLLENDDTTSTTIDTYYDAINTVLAEAPKVLPAEIDPRPAYLETLRIDAGLSTDELSKKLRVFAGIKISKIYLDRMEGGRLDKDVIDNLYPDIKNFLETFIREEK